MATSNRIITFLETAKNVVIVLGIPTLGLYMWNYHRTQIDLKDSIIQLQEVQLKQAKELSVELAHTRLVSMKSLYENLLSSTNDSLIRKNHLLDSLASTLSSIDTTWREFEGLVIAPRKDIEYAFALRKTLDILLKECRDENLALRQKHGKK